MTRLAGLPSIAEAAVIAGVSRRTITRALAGECGRLRHLRIGNRVGIHPDDLQAWLRGFAVVPKPAIELPPDLSHFFPELALVTPGSPGDAAGRSDQNKTQAAQRVAVS